MCGFGLTVLWKGLRLDRQHGGRLRPHGHHGARQLSHLWAAAGLPSQGVQGSLDPLGPFCCDAGGVYKEGLVNLITSKPQNATQPPISSNVSAPWPQSQRNLENSVDSKQPFQPQ